MFIINMQNTINIKTTIKIRASYLNFNKLILFVMLNKIYIMIIDIIIANIQKTNNAIEEPLINCRPLLAFDATF